MAYALKMKPIGCLRYIGDMMENVELINKYALDVSKNTLDRLDMIAKIENIENGWSEEKFFSFDPLGKDRWYFNFYGKYDNMYFSRVGNTNYFVLESISIENKILKAVLLLRHFTKRQSKEKQREEARNLYKNEPNILDEWIQNLKEELKKTPEQREKESEIYCEEIAQIEAEQEYQERMSRSSFAEKEYGPSNPWDAPGMSIKDFI